MMTLYCRLPLFSVTLMFSLLVLAIPVAGQAQTAETDETAREATDPPTYPSRLDDPDIGLDEFRLRLLPLTSDELEPLAEAWRDRAKDATQAVVEKMVEIRDEGSDATEAQKQVRSTLVDQRKAIFDRYAAVVSSLEAKGGAPDLVSQLRTYQKAITVAEKATLTPAE